MVEQGELRDFADSIAEVVSESGGYWQACSGCQESNEGSVSTDLYPFSTVFQCQPGGGCSECGGLGVVWDNTDWSDYAEWSVKQDRTRDNIKAALNGSLRVCGGAIFGLNEAADAILALEPVASTAPVRTAPVLEGELLPVIQDDREAAADMVEDLDRFASGLLRASRIRRGELDDSPEVGAIAAHRLCHSTDFERENAVYTSDGDPVRLGVQAAECDAAADLIEQLQARLAEAEGLAQQAHDALDAMMRTWLDYHDAHSLTDPMTGASGNAFDKALDARDAAASWLAGR